MRVLVLCEYGSLNGGERSLLEAARRIAATDIEIVVAAPSQGPLAAALDRHNLRHLPLDCFDFQSVRPPRRSLQRRISECITGSHADVVHANSVSMSRLTAPVVQELGVPSIGHLRDIIRLSKASVEDLNRHGCLLAVSQATRQWYMDAGLSETKIAVAYNGVDLRCFRPRPAQASLHQELNIPPNTPLVGGVGQIGMRKGVDLFVEAAAQVAGVWPEVHFIYVGQRYSQKQEAVAFEQEVRSASAQGGLRGRFHFLGVRDDVELILSELAVYVHAARQEPLGRVLLEAGASGVAIVATDVGGTREIFPPSTGAARLVPPQSSTALAEAVDQLIKYPEERRVMGGRARHRVTEAFDGAEASRLLERWYRKLANLT